MKQIYTFTFFSFFMFIFFSSQAQEVWIGDDIIVTKEGGADWTLEENQDKLTDNVWLTRQSVKAIYNYKWWQDNFGTDATAGDLEFNFWNEDPADATQDFMASGGTQGIRWALLDDTGSSSDWSGYDFGVLGDPTNFHSFNNIMEIIKILQTVDGDYSTIEVIDDFSVLFDGYTFDVPDVGDYIVGKKFGLWLVEDDVYLSLTFDSWGTGASGAGFTYTRSTDALLNTDPEVISPEIKISPNPTSDFINFKGIKGQNDYIIYNSLGAKVSNGRVSNNDQVNVQELQAGMYFISFNNEESLIFVKR